MVFTAGWGGGGATGLNQKNNICNIFSFKVLYHKTKGKRREK